MRILFAILMLTLDLVPSGKAWMKQLQQRDSVLIADQLEYGFTLEGVTAETRLALPDYSRASNDTLTLVRGWKLDTLRTDRKTGTMDIRGTVVLAPFEAGTYRLPPVWVQRTVGQKVDTLEFEAPELEVKTMPVDTSTFIPHDIKGQIGYPLTFREVIPWVLGGLALCALVLLCIRLYRNRSRKEDAGPKDPPYVVALRKLDRYRGDRYWAPDQQKAFYSGVTDALKEYMEARFGVDAPEMTTAELFDALKSEKDITPATHADLKDLFERADFVKFAKHLASDSENATVLPVAVKFVTDTYQSQLEEEQPAKEEGKDVL